MKSFDNLAERPILRFENIAPEVYKALDKLKRTGWVNREVANPESVKEHTESLIRLVRELRSLLTEEELDELEEMLEVHDWPEAISGDEIILETRPGERKKLKEEKFEREKVALTEICRELSNGEEIMRLWLRSETSNDLSAILARELDKYQAVEKALEYELAQGMPLFEEFLTYSINFIHHPVLLERIERLKARWEASKGLI